MQEYLHYGQKWSLADSCDRRKVARKKGDMVEEFRGGTGFDAMPRDVVEEYGLADIISTRELLRAGIVLRDSNAPMRSI